MRFSSHEIYENKNKSILVVKNSLNDDLFFIIGIEQFPYLFSFYTFFFYSKTKK
jgi:hypothetical protein